MSPAAPIASHANGPVAETDTVAMAKAGDTEAFGRLVENYQRMVHSLAYRMTGSGAEAADIAQEVFVRAWRELPRFRGESSFSTWIHRIAVNLCLNWNESGARRLRLREQWANDSIESGATPTEQERIDRVNEALKRLSPDYRAAIALTVYEGLTHREAASVLGCAETTVSWKVWRAKSQLKGWLADLAPNPKAVA
jgi:RNA polymerase sigma-70 factor, ECF subfamily